jgi:hypothetical protein
MNINKHQKVEYYYDVKKIKYNYENNKDKQFLYFNYLIIFQFIKLMVINNPMNLNN